MKKKGLLSRLAELSAGVSPSRLGTAAPAAAVPLVGAPTGRPGHGHARRALLRRSLRACSAEGLVAEVIAACAGGAILTGWALYLHASPLVTGLILGLSQLAQVFQIPAAWTTSWLGQRRAAIVLVGASRQALLPLAALPFLPVSDGARQGLLLGVAAFSSILGVLGNNAWVSWMSDLVPKRVRGRYFGRRTALCTMGGALSAAAVGLLLDGAAARDLTGEALALLQVVACMCGVVTTLLMVRQHDPAPAQQKASLDLARALAPLRDPNVRALLVYLAAWNAAVGVAGSFFALHMLRNLKMGFALVALQGTALALVRMVAAPLWGRFMDRHGARPVLLACSFGISAIPFIWLFPSAEDLFWPLAIDCVVAGILWCGHALATFNLPLAVTPRPERPFYLAAFAMVSGVAFSLATLLGGLIAEVVPDSFVLGGRTLHDLHVVFAISGVLRLAASFVAVRIREPEADGVDALWSALATPLARLKLALSLRLRSVPTEEPVGSRARGGR